MVGYCTRLQEPTVHWFVFPYHGKSLGKVVLEDCQGFAAGAHGGRGGQRPAREVDENDELLGVVFCLGTQRWELVGVFSPQRVL